VEEGLFLGGIPPGGRNLFGLSELPDPDSAQTEAMSAPKPCKLQKIDVEQVPIEALVPYIRNAKKHDGNQVAAIAASIREFGFNAPVLIDSENGIIAGHGRVLAARKLELTTVPCIRLTHLNDAQKRAYVIADNRLGEVGGGWDWELLKVEADALDIDGLDLNLTGFSVSDIEQMLNQGDGDRESLEGFQETRENTKTEHRCPKCGHAWTEKSE
jgi:ParB-like chromosome segregation protein Spo0J